MSRLIAKTDVTYALGYSPYDASNPLGFSTLVQMTSALTGYATVASVTAQIAAVQAGSMGATGGLVLVPGTTTPRRIDGRFGEVANVRDFGAKGDGATSDGQALSAASAFAQLHGLSVYIPPGRYRIDCSGTPFSVYSGAPVRGVRGKSILLADDSSGGTVRAVSNPTGQSGDIDIQDLTIIGMADTLNSPAGQPLAIEHAANVTLRNIEVIYSRSFGISVQRCGSASVQGCKVFRSIADGISVSDTPNTIINGNTVDGADDDGISCHTSDNQPAPARSGVVITNNVLSESQGISCLGAKTLLISGNVMRRMKAYGIYVYASPYFSGGDTPIFSLKITNNIITDVFRRPEPNPRNQEQGYVQVIVGSRKAGTGLAAPGDPNGIGGTVPLLGTFKGAFYVQGTDQATTASPGARWLDITGNTLVRTLPACGAYADWGYGQGLWVADRVPGGLYFGAIAEANLETDGILLSGTIRNSRITGNIIETTGQRCVYLGANTAGAQSGFINQGDFNGLEIADNQMRDFSAAAIYWNATVTTNHQMRVRNNTFDGDPRHVHPNRRGNGTWADASLPAVLYGDGLSGAAFEGNHIRNVSHLFDQRADAYSLFRNNTVFADAPYVGGWDARNKGVGLMPALGNNYLVVREDSDPVSPTYGRALSPPAVIVGATEFTGPIKGSGGFSTGNDASNGNLNIGPGGAAMPYLTWNSGFKAVNDQPNRLTFADPGGSIIVQFIGGAAPQMFLTGSHTSMKATTMWGQTPLTAQPAAPTTLADVILILRGMGACA